MGIQDINNAAAAQNALTARINAFLDTIDADIATRQAAYDALSGDLEAVVNNRMYFLAVLDPDEQNPTNVRGGVFNRFDTIINAAPHGALIYVNIDAGKVVNMDYDVTLRDQALFISKQGVGDNPVIRFGNHIVSGLYNTCRGFQYYWRSGVYTHHVDFVIDPATDPNLGWQWRNAPFRAASSIVAGQMVLSTAYADISIPENAGLITPHTGGVLSLSTAYGEAHAPDGEVTGGSVISNNVNGVTLFSNFGMAITSPVTLTDNGVETNIFTR